MKRTSKISDSSIRERDGSPPPDEGVITLEPKPLFSRVLHMFSSGLAAGLSGGYVLTNILLALRGEKTMSGSLEALVIFAVSLSLFRIFSARIEQAVRPVPLYPSERSDRKTIYRVPQENFFLVLLHVVKILAGTVLLTAFLYFYWRTPFPFEWLVNDSILAVVGSSLLLLFSSCGFTIDTQENRIKYCFSTPFHRSSKEISFDEICAVVVGGSFKSLPLLFPFHRMVFSTSLLFKDGSALPILGSSSASRDPEKALKQHLDGAYGLSAILGRPWFAGPFLAYQTFRDWRENVESLAASAPDSKVMASRLWELGMGCSSFSSDRPDVVHVDLSTGLEQWILGLITLAMAGFTIWLLGSEIKFLQDNPRVLYLLLLDGTSILATILALWYGVIDQHYILNLEAKTIHFHTRFLFFRFSSLVCPFSEIQEASVQSRRHGKATYYQTCLRRKNGEVIWMSDECLTPGIPEFRAQALKKLLW